MTETEQWYVQVEKEAMAIVWACDKFSCYILGKHFEIKTDHKPLVPLLGTKHLDTLHSGLGPGHLVGKDFSFQVEKLLCNTLQYHNIR